MPCVCGIDTFSLDNNLMAVYYKYIKKEYNTEF